MGPSITSCPRRRDPRTTGCRDGRGRCWRTADCRAVGVVVVGARQCCAPTMSLPYLLARKRAVSGSFGYAWALCVDDLQMHVRQEALPVRGAWQAVRATSGARLPFGHLLRDDLRILPGPHVREGQRGTCAVVTCWSRRENLLAGDSPPPSARPSRCVHRNARSHPRDSALGRAASQQTLPTSFWRSPTWISVDDSWRLQSGSHKAHQRAARQTREERLAAKLP